MNQIFCTLFILYLICYSTYASILDSSYLEVDTAPIYVNESTIPGNGTVNVGISQSLFKVSFGNNIFVRETLSITPFENELGEDTIDWKKGNNQILVVGGSASTRTLTYIPPKYPTPLRLEIQYTSNIEDITLPTTSDYATPFL